MSDINRDFTEALKKKYPDFDLRIIIPIYNARNIVSLNGFEIEDLNIKADYSYGLNKSYANLYKVKSTDNEVETYAVYSPAFSLFFKNSTGIGNPGGTRLSYLVLLFLLIIELGNTKSSKAPDDRKNPAGVAQDCPWTVIQSLYAKGGSL